MTIQELEEDLLDEHGNFDRSESARIHTRIMEIAAESAEQIVAELNLPNRSPEDVDPREVLEAIAAHADAEAESLRLGLIASASEELRAVLSDLPAEDFEILAEVAERLAQAESVDELDTVLSEYLDHDDERVGAGAMHAKDLLDSGADSVYSEESVVAEVGSDPEDPPESRTRRAVKAVAEPDAQGAVAGAIGGAAFGGGGALPGALVGAVTGSPVALLWRAAKKLRNRN